MDIWTPTIVVSNVNLRIEKGHRLSDYKLLGSVARTQLKFNPDIIGNLEDMPCISYAYKRELKDYTQITAYDDPQQRGVSCWVKKTYSVKKIYSMSSPHFMHAVITNDAGIELNVVIMRILVSDSSVNDYKDRAIQWIKAVQYIYSIKDKKNLVVAGDLNHGFIDNPEAYIGKPREHYNYQLVQQSLAKMNIQIVQIPGYSYKGFLAIDHLAVSPSVEPENARYEDVYGSKLSKIGIPDHSYIVSKIKMCG